MPLSLEQLTTQLTESGLLSADQLRDFQQQHNPADAEQLIRLLAKNKLLTTYQAQQAFAGKAKSLVLGNYVLLEKLGQGGMGMVLKAQHRRMKRLVALKVLSPAVVKSPELIARFHREVEAVAKLSHPNIVAAFDADESNGTSFLVMEYVDGKDLASVVKSNGPLSIAQACKCILQAARGLEYAHQQHIIHRDIKPANLLVDHQGAVKILDMGLARIDNEAGKSDLTSTGAVMGTVDYMAPEQALSTKHADARSDIYSLGISLWYLLIGRAAYDGDSMMARLLGHRDAAIPSLADALAQRKAAKPIPPERAATLDGIFHKMVAKKPEDRYQSMAEVIHALEALQSGDVSIVHLSATSTSAADPTRSMPQAVHAEGDAAHQITRAEAAATATFKKPAEDEHLVPGSPFAATVTSGNQDSPTDPVPATRPGVKRLLLNAGDVGKSSQKSSRKSGRRNIGFAAAALGGFVLLGFVALTMKGKDVATTKAEAPEAPNQESSTKREGVPAAASSKSVAATTPIAAATSDPIWTTLVGTEEDLSKHWQMTGPFRLDFGDFQADEAGIAVTRETYDDFELIFEWKLNAKANGGVFYHTSEFSTSTVSGKEYQLLDNAGYSEKISPQMATGSIWGLVAPQRDVTKAVGEWNTGRIIAQGKHLEHWLNAIKIVDIDIGSQPWQDALSKANDRTRTNVGHRAGRIVVQNQSGTIAFRNMRIKRLPSPPADSSRSVIQRGASGTTSSATGRTP